MICLTCKLQKAKQECADADHNISLIDTYYKWRRPKKNNKKAWARIFSGELWWDRKAVAKVEIKQAQWIYEYQERLRLKRRK